MFFLGNSLTQLGGDWSEKFSTTGVRNRGIAGDVTDGVLARLDEIIYVKPKAVFILIGINDLFNLHKKEGIPSAKYVGENIIKIAQSISNNSPETTVYVQTLLPTKYSYLKDYITEVNTLLKAHKAHYKLIDLHERFVSSSGFIKEDLTNDGTHLTAKGYAVWVDFLRPLMLYEKEKLRFVYPNGASKALMMSYDDGIDDDKKLVKLFNKHNIIGTFNLNSGFLGTTQAWAQRDGDTVYQKYISANKIPRIYKHHEIASHGRFHKNYTKISDEDLINDLRADILNFQQITQQPIRSFAYPFGASNTHVAKLLQKEGITNARTVKGTCNFYLPDQYLLWHPTCKDQDALKHADAFLNLKDDRLYVFYVWGHAWELRDAKKWTTVKQFCEHIGQKKDIWYVGAAQLTNYLKALNNLKYTTTSITNPVGNPTLWYRKDGKLQILKAGTELKR